MPMNVANHKEIHSCTDHCFTNEIDDLAAPGATKMACGITTKSQLSGWPGCSLRRVPILGD